MRRSLESLTLTLVALGLMFAAGCASTVSNKSQNSSNSAPSQTPAITVSVIPSAANVRAGAAQNFIASVSGNSNTAVSWTVNGVAGGNSATGTISSMGVYTAPAQIPANNAVTIGAVSSANASASGTASVTLLNPIPMVSVVSPMSVTAGAGNAERERK